MASKINTEPGEPDTYTSAPPDTGHAQDDEDE